MTQINTIHSPCKKCIFAIYNNITQTGCHLNYIDKFREKNIEILEAYDDELEFYIINGKKCLGYREPSWLQRFNLENAPVEDQIKKLLEFNILYYLTIIDLSQFADPKDLLQVCADLANHAVPPRKIIFIRHRSDALTNYSFTTIDNIIKESKLKCQWRLQSMIDDSITYDEIVKNIISLNTKYRFILTITSKPENLNVITEANRIVYDDFGQFVILSNADKTCMLFSSIIYRFGIKNNENMFEPQTNYIIV